MGKQHGGAPWPSTPRVLLPTPSASSPTPSAPAILSAAPLPSSLPWMLGQWDLGCVPAVVPDTSSPPPPRVPLDPQGSSPRDLSQGPALTPKSEGVDAGGHTAFKYSEHRAHPGSVLSPQVCLWGSVPAPISWDSHMTWRGLEGGSGAWLARGSMLLGTHGGS